MRGWSNLSRECHTSKIALSSEHKWAPMTLMFAYGVACTSASRLSHPARARFENSFVFWKKRSISEPSLHVLDDYHKFRIRNIGHGRFHSSYARSRASSLLAWKKFFFVSALVLSFTTLVTNNSRQKMGWHRNCRARSLSACNARPL